MNNGVGGRTRSGIAGISDDEATACTTVQNTFRFAPSFDEDLAHLLLTLFDHLLT